MLTAVILVVGLVWISRGIGGSLKALSTLQQYHQMLQLAESTLNNVEVEAQVFRNLRDRQGAFPAPHALLQWTLTITPVPYALGDVPPERMRAVTVTVSRADARPPSVRLLTMWPSDWVAE